MGRTFDALLPRDRIVSDTRFQMRADDGLDLDHVKDLVEARVDDRADVFRVDGIDYLVEGNHREAAWRKRGMDVIPCRVHEGTFDDAFRFALGVNRHGKKRTAADVRHAAHAAFRYARQPGVILSDAEIALCLYVDRSRVSQLRREWEKSGNPPGLPAPDSGCPEEGTDANVESPDLAAAESAGVALAEGARIAGRDQADPDGVLRAGAARGLEAVTTALAALGSYAAGAKHVRALAGLLFGAPADRPPHETRVDRENRTERGKGGRPKTGRAAG